MSCGTCPTSAQPTTRQDGTAPTPGSLLWSADVGDWYRRQRAQGAPPAISLPAGPPAPTAGPSPAVRDSKLAQAIGRLLALGQPGDLCDGGIHGGIPRMVGFDDPIQERLAHADEAICCAWGQSSGKGSMTSLVFREGTYVTCLTADLDDGTIQHRDRRCRSEATAQAVVKRWTEHGMLFYCIRCRAAHFSQLSPNGLCPACQGAT